MYLDDYYHYFLSYPSQFVQTNCIEYTDFLSPLPHPELTAVYFPGGREGVEDLKGGWEKEEMKSEEVERTSGMMMVKQ